MKVQLKFTLKQCRDIAYESTFIKEALELLARKKSKLECSSNIQKAWRELTVDMETSEIVANSTESAILFKFIQIAFFKADKYLNEVKQEYKHDNYTPLVEAFDKLRNDLTYIQKQTKGLHAAMIEIIVVLWILKRRLGKDGFSSFWPSSKEDWELLRGKNPELFERVSVSPVPSKPKEKKMRKQDATKKKKVAILVP